MESSDKTWSTGEGHGKSLQYSGHENAMNCIKRQRDITLKDETLRSEGVNMPLGKSEGQLIVAPERMKQLDQSRNHP